LGFTFHRRAVRETIAKRCTGLLTQFERTLMEV